MAGRRPDLCLLAPACALRTEGFFIYLRQLLDLLLQVCADVVAPQEEGGDCGVDTEPLGQSLGASISDLVAPQVEVGDLAVDPEQFRQGLGTAVGDVVGIQREVGDMSVVTERLNELDDFIISDAFVSPRNSGEGRIIRGDSLQIAAGRPCLIRERHDVLIAVG